MIKIDFHIHTVPTSSDSPFLFSFETIQKYVREAKLDAIAITNHNMFDLNQYRQIADAVPDSRVYPGIEIDLEKGHLLLIADIDNVDDFAEKCNEVTQKEPSRDNSLSLDEFKQIFPDLSNYILIPHYKKNPVIPDEIIDQLGEFITAGEVTSPKKFMHCIKDETGLVPVYFSDSRMYKDLSIPVRQTYLGCEGVEFRAIKICLSDRSKVTLSRDEGNKLFQIFGDGQMISTGLSIVLGQRASGKSHTLNQISQKQHDFEKIKYIKQFSLVERSEEKDEEKFDKLLHQKHSLLSQDYLKPLNDVISNVIDIDIEADDKNVFRYVNSLVKHAKESERHDVFSKAKLFSEQEFGYLNNDELKQLISSTKNLVSNKEFRTIITKHVSIDSLKKLYVELMEEYLKKDEKEQKKNWLNGLIINIKDQLEIKSAATPIAGINLYNIAMNRKKIDTFKKVIKLAKTERTLERKNLQGKYHVVARSVHFSGAEALQKRIKRQVAFSEAHEKYENPYEYLQELKNVINLSREDIHKCFINIEYKILNKYSVPVSGGERSEVNLLEEVKDAQNYDMLLIDEPESSFDNLFLKEDVNAIIKDIAKKMPVVIVTHNNTVGFSIKPDYILYTQKEMENGEPVYRVYSGHPTNKDLLSLDNKSIKTLKVAMDSLEAGEDAYNERKQDYENIRN